MTIKINKERLRDCGIFNLNDFVITSRKAIAKTIANLAVLDDQQLLGNMDKQQLIHGLKEVDWFLKKIKDH